MSTIQNRRFTKLRLQLELLASHTSYSADNFVFKYVYDNVEVPTRNFGNIRLYDVQYSIDKYFIIEYYVGNVRLLETYDLSTSNGGLQDCSDILGEVIDLISEVIDCVTLSFTDNTKAKAFLNEYLDRGSKLDTIISSEFEDRDTIVYWYVDTDFITVYTKDFNNRNAYRVNKYFVEHLVDTNLLNDTNVKNFQLVSHYADIIHSDKDTEIAYY
jgi:hypothetical protein